MLEGTYVIVIQFIIETSKTFFKKMREKIVANSSAYPRSWGMGPPYNDLYEEASPERGTFSTLQVYESGSICKGREVCHLGILKGLSLKVFH